MLYSRPMKKDGYLDYDYAKYKCSLEVIWGKLTPPVQTYALSLPVFYYRASV